MITTYPDDHIITQAEVDLLISNGACRPGAKRSLGLTVGEAASRHPEAALRYAAQLLTPERLDACAKAAPYVALEYADHLLHPGQLDACAQADPWAALRYAANLLTPERLDWCKQQASPFQL